MTMIITTDPSAVQLFYNKVKLVWPLRTNPWAGSIKYLKPLGGKNIQKIPIRSEKKNHKNGAHLMVEVFI